MNQNTELITTMLQQQGFEATQPAKQAIIDFSILYAKKLITKCLRGNKININAEDVRYTYEIMNKMHSVQYQNQLNQRKNKLANYINKDLNANKFQKSPADVITVSLYPNSQTSHMRTSWQYQIGFQNS